MLARYINEADLRFIQSVGGGAREVIDGSPAASAEIARSLGVLPDHNVKIFVGVEGRHDISFLKSIARMLKAAGEDVPDLEQLELDGELIFIPLGGSNLALWTSRLAHLNRPELHICDRDIPPPAAPKYDAHIVAVNSRDGCEAIATQKRELENYLHFDAISEAYARNGVTITFPGHFADFDDVPALVAQAVHLASGGDPWAGLDDEKKRRKESQAKKQLNEIAVKHMNVARLADTDPNNEIRAWLSTISRMMAGVG